MTDVQFKLLLLRENNSRLTAWSGNFYVEPFQETVDAVGHLREGLFYGGATRKMSQRDKLLVKILLGTSDTNIPFDSLRKLLRALGFGERIRGSHHIFSKDSVEEILNLQSKKGS